MTDHFHGKDALTHLAEKQAQGILSSKEVHGLEIPGPIHAFTDAGRNLVIIISILYAILIHFDWMEGDFFKVLLLASFGAAIWFGGRAAWLGWSRLERLHRILAQEKWEIEHNRPQERDELTALYGAKGFEGKLLDDVVDVLMADESRLLKVMIEEEMGLSLENVDHPLKQGVYAFAGAILSAIICLTAFVIPFGIFAAALILIILLSSYTAYKADNRLIPASVWSAGMAVLSIGSVYFIAGFLFE